MALARIMPTISNSAASGLNYSALIAAGVRVPEFIEQGMDADFSFDLPEPASFRSRVSPFEIDRAGKAYFLQDNSVGKYLVLTAGTNGMRSPTPDARTMTYAAIYNYRTPSPETAWQTIMGSLTDTAGEGGESVAINSTGSIDLNIRGYSGTPARVNFNELGNQGFPANNTNSFVFIAVTSRLTGGADQETEHTLFVGAPTPIISQRTGVKIIGNRPVALGNAYRASAVHTEMTARIARFFSGRGGRDYGQLVGMYQRAKVVAARRGITVF